MSRAVAIRSWIVGILCLAAVAGDGFAAEQPTDKWLRGSGKDLELCLRGEVFDSDGQPAKNIEVAGNLNATIGVVPLRASIDGHRFEIWVPVNPEPAYSGWLKASSADSDRIAYETFSAYEIRQAAVEGIKLTLASPTRQVDVKVLDNDRPVSGATVKAEVGYSVAVRSTTDANGVARLALLPQQKLSDITAWTNDHRMGGFTFHRTPPRDPEADEHVIELSKCRPQRVRFVAEDGSPVAGVRFELHIATPPPHYNYIGSTNLTEMTTDESGEAVWPWFPDWEKVHFYADIDDPNWVVEGEPKMTEGVAVIGLKERKPRKQITGRVVADGADTGPGGFYVHFRSFQGEREHQSDLDSAFSNADGTFSISVLPGATYCAYVLDEQWVGKIIDVIAYDAAADKAASPELTIAEGQPVEVIVMSGPKKVPLENLTVSFRRDHSFTWLENGDVKHGTGGPQFWATTDESGKALTRTLPGKLTASIYTPRWRTEKSVDVAGNDPVQIALHREIDETRTYSGRVILDEGASGRLDDIEIRVGSLDANYEDEQTFKCKAHGLFSFETFAAEVGILATTRDGKAAGSMITKDLEWRIKLPLIPTCEFQGQLLGAGDRPIANHLVRAHILLQGKKPEGAMVPPHFAVRITETKTDAQGDYTLTGLPSRTEVRIWADPIGDSSDHIHIDDVVLEPNETRARAVKRIGQRAGAK